MCLCRLFLFKPSLSSSENVLLEGKGEFWFLFLLSPKLALLPKGYTWLCDRKWEEAPGTHDSANWTDQFTSWHLPQVILSQSFIQKPPDSQLRNIWLLLWRSFAFSSLLAPCKKKIFLNSPFVTHAFHYLSLGDKNLKAFVREDFDIHYAS